MAKKKFLSKVKSAVKKASPKLKQAAKIGAVGLTTGGVGLGAMAIATKLKKRKEKRAATGKGKASRIAKRTEKKKTKLSAKSDKRKMQLAAKMEKLRSKRAAKKEKRALKQEGKTERIKARKERKELRKQGVFVPEIEQDENEQITPEEQDYAGDEEQDYTGDEEQDYAGDEEQDYAGDEEQDYTGDEEQDYTGDEEQDYAGDEEQDYLEFADKSRKAKRKAKRSTKKAARKTKRKQRKTEGSTLIGRSAFAPLLPFKKAMIKGIEAAGKKAPISIDSIAKMFYKVVVQKKNFEETPDIVNEYFEYGEQADNFVAGAIPVIIKAIVSFLKGTKDKVESGQPVSKTEEKIAAAVTEIDKAGTQYAKETAAGKIGEFVMQPTFIMVAAVLLILVFINKTK